MYYIELYDWNSNSFLGLYSECSKDGSYLEQEADRLEVPGKVKTRLVFKEAGQIRDPKIDFAL